MKIWFHLLYFDDEPEIKREIINIICIIIYYNIILNRSFIKITKIKFINK